MTERIRRTSLTKLLLALILLEIVGAGAYLLSLGKGKVVHAPTVSVEPLNPPRAQLSLKVGKDSFRVGERGKILVTLTLNETAALSAIDLSLSYDPNLLKINDADPQQPGTQVEIKEHRLHWPRNKVSVEKGKGIINLTGYTESETVFSEKTVLVSIDFEALHPGQAGIALNFTPGSSQESNVLLRSSGEDILEGVENTTLSIVE